MDPAKLARVAMMHRRQCYFAPDFVSPEECSELAAWAKEMRPHLRNVEPERYNRNVAALPRLSPLYTPLRLRLQTLFSLPEDAREEPRIGWFLAIHEPGSQVIPHRDATPPGTHCLRCNLFLQTATSGGLPVIENAPFEVKAGTLLAFLPSELRHWSQPVGGSEWRIVLSFGYTVPAGYRLPPSPHA